MGPSIIVKHDVHFQSELCLRKIRQVNMFATMTFEDKHDMNSMEWVGREDEGSTRVLLPLIK